MIVWDVVDYMIVWGVVDYTILLDVVDYTVVWDVVDYSIVWGVVDYTVVWDVVDYTVLWDVVDYTIVWDVVDSVYCLYFRKLTLHADYQMRQCSGAVWKWMWPSWTQAYSAYCLCGLKATLNLNSYRKSSGAV